MKEKLDWEHGTGKYQDTQCQMLKQQAL
jgi:hypothetical protein